MIGRGLALAVAGLVLSAGCAEVKGQSDAGPSPGTAGTGLPPLPDGAAGSGGLGSLVDALGAPPIDFTTADIGGYKRGPQLASGASSNPGTGPKVCNTIVGVVRDFKGALPAAGGTLEAGGHPDFEVFEGRGPTRELVASDLAADGKPAYVSRCERGAAVSLMCPFGAMTTTKANFDQWYRSIDGVNIPYLIYFSLVAGEGGVPTFYSKHFFPLDLAGWGNSGIGKDDQGMKDIQRNFSFTTEVHTKFKYMGGEHFDFEGDDDVWVFINHKLAVDLGGLHFPEKGSVDLDAQAATLAIAKGSVYDLDLFHAERHSIDSNFRIEMNFTFEDCGYVVP